MIPLLSERGQRARRKKRTDIDTGTPFESYKQSTRNDGGQHLSVRVLQRRVGRGPHPYVAVRLCQFRHRLRFGTERRRCCMGNMVDREQSCRCRRKGTPHPIEKSHQVRHVGSERAARKVSGCSCGGTKAEERRWHGRGKARSPWWLNVPPRRLARPARFCDKF